MRERPVLAILLSAFFFGLSTPLSKLLLRNMSPIFLAGLLYIGAFAGLLVYSLLRRICLLMGFSEKGTWAAPLLGKKDIPWLAGAIVSGGIIGPICLMAGLAETTGFSASLLLNLEGTATAFLAVYFFREQAGKALWLALGCMTLAGIFTAWDPARSRLSLGGPLLILLAMICWGLDNNLTRNISDKDPFQIAGVKGFFAGLATLSLALALGRTLPFDRSVALALLLGATGYGLSLVLFIKALKGLGAFRAGAFFSLAPFIGALSSLFLLKEPLKWPMFPATAFMVLGVLLIVLEKHGHRHRHSGMSHAHAHVHSDLHHIHPHPEKTHDPHSHEHSHEEIDHIHVHWPDIHHRHKH